VNLCALNIICIYVYRDEYALFMQVYNVLLPIWLANYAILVLILSKGFSALIVQIHCVAMRIWNLVDAVYVCSMLISRYANTWVIQLYIIHNGNDTGIKLSDKYGDI
jgi:hypothetical protein